MAATSPAGGAAPRLRSVDSSSGDMEMAGVPRAELKEHKDSHQTRSRAVGSLAHVAATALKRKNAVVRVAVALIVAFFAAAGIAKVTRRFLFHSDVVGHCDALPSTARVAVLLAGSPRAFNRTHCSFARRVVKPLRDRGHPVDVFFSSTEPLADERFGVGTERAALKKLRSDHDVAFTIIDVAATARAPETCAAALRERFDAKDSSSRRFVDRREERRVKETTLDDDESLRNYDDERTLDDRATTNDSAFGESGDVIAEYLLLLRARAAADASRRKQTRGSGNFGNSPHAWIVAADSAHAYADDLPVHALCAVPGGRKLLAPWVRARGGVNDRFAMGQAPAMEEYAGMYHALCPEDAAMRAPPEDERDGAVTDTDTSAEARIAGSRRFAASVPRGVDSTERLLAWHMRRRHVGVDTDALYRFVPYETPADPSKRLDDEDWPNARIGRSAFNPSRGNFDALVDEVERCVLEESTF